MLLTARGPGEKTFELVTISQSCDVGEHAARASILVLSYDVTQQWQTRQTFLGLSMGTAEKEGVYYMYISSPLPSCSLP